MKVLYNNLVSKHIGNEIESPARVLGIESEQTNIDRKLAIKLIDDLYNNSKLNLKIIRKMCENKSEIAESKLNLDSYEAIITSVGLALKAQKQNDLALVRPPGHHANLYNSRGFCIINNIAVVVNKLLKDGGRVAIVDIDGHHGNGTHDIFKKNDNLLLCSLYQNYAYPFIAKKEKQSNNALYIPLDPESGDDVFKATFNLFIEKIKKFKPDVIAISAGFDGYFDDSLLNLNFTEHSYYYAGKELRKLDVPTFALLEGGYHDNLNDCIQSFISGFNEQKFIFKSNKTTAKIL